MVCLLICGSNLRAILGPLGLRRWMLVRAILGLDAGAMLEP